MMAHGPGSPEYAEAHDHALAIGRQAVVDIGSNSVRLVVYDGPRRAPMPICNEKALCGLGRDMTAEGDLNPDASEYALATLRRFRRLLEEFGDPPTRVIATAAVREAGNGKAFVKEIAKLGFDVDVIAGGEEALLAAKGVISYEPGASGIVGDMGGGSLELVALSKGQIKNNDSLSIGPLRLMQKSDGKIANTSTIIDPILDSVSWLKPKKFETLYSVGGAWRAIARIHMRLRSYPLSVLHHYELSQAEAIEICDLVSKQSRRSLEEIPGIPRRRLDTLPFAAVVFKAVLQRTRVKRVVVSAGGVREGLLYQDLSDAEREKDPLIDGARFFAVRLSPEASFGEALPSLTNGLFPDESAACNRIRLATCLLSDIASFFHPDLRAMQAFDTALRAPFYGVTHEERISIALSLFCRHDGGRPSFPDENVVGLLDWEEQQRAVRLGLAMRFAGALAPKSPAAIDGCTLSYSDDKVVFNAPVHVESLMGEHPRKRLEALAAAFEAEAVETYF